MITSDIVLLGLIAATLGAIFWAASGPTPALKTFFKWVPALLLCYFIPAIYNTAGLIPVFKAIYEDTETHWEAYAVAEQLVDIEVSFQIWRFRHMKAVERIIGYRRGTGGSSGVGFLKQAMDLTFFPELFEVRTVIGQ